MIPPLLVIGSSPPAVIVPRDVADQAWAERAWRGLGQDGYKIRPETLHGLVKSGFLAVQTLFAGFDLGQAFIAAANGVRRAP